MQTIQVYAMTTPIEMSPPMSYWKAYETKTNLWSVLNKVSVPVPNQPQLLHPGMRIVAAIKGKTYQGYFAGYTHISSKSPQAVIVPEMVKQPWMDEEPQLDGAQKTMWSNKISSMGGQLIPIVHVPITFYSDTVQHQTPIPLNGNHVAVSKTPLNESINADHALSPNIPVGIPGPIAAALLPPSLSVPVKEKIVNIGGKKAKIVEDDVFIEDWVDLETAPEKYRIIDVIVDGKKVEPESYILQMLDWVQQKDDPVPGPEVTLEDKPKK